MVTHGPSTASGGITAWSRDPSGRRASTIGDGAVETETERRDDSFHQPHDGGGIERQRHLLQPPRALDVGTAGPVQHHLGDRRIGQQRLERAESGTSIGELVDEPVELIGGKQGPLVAQQVPEPIAQCRGAERRVVGALGEEPPVDPKLQLVVGRWHRHCVRTLGQTSRGSSSGRRDPRA